VFALAEFIRELIVQGTHEGLAAARARGERIGRPPVMTEEQIRHARALLVQPENTVTSIAKLLGVSRTTLYKYVPQLAAGRDSLVAGSPRLFPLLAPDTEILRLGPGLLAGPQAYPVQLSTRALRDGASAKSHQHRCELRKQQRHKKSRHVRGMNR
jgi:transposase-like protein